MVEFFKNKVTGEHVPAVMWEDNQQNTLEVVKFLDRKVTIKRKEDKEPSLRSKDQGLKMRAYPGYYNFKKDGYIDTLNADDFAVFYDPEPAPHLESGNGVPPAPESCGMKGALLEIQLFPDFNNSYSGVLGISKNRVKELKKAYKIILDKHSKSLGTVTLELSKIVANHNEFAFIMQYMGQDVSVKFNASGELGALLTLLDLQEREKPRQE